MKRSLLCLLSCPLLVSGRVRRRRSLKGEGGERLSDEGVVVELSQTGPPTRKLKSPIVTIGRSLLLICFSV